jgi:hypothetical protein
MTFSAQPRRYVIPPPLLIRAMEIAVSTKQAVYDCIYLALAEAEGCELVTADDQFARGLRSSYPFVVSLNESSMTLRATIRYHVTRQRRPLARFFACARALPLVLPGATVADAGAPGVGTIFVVRGIADDRRRAGTSATHCGRIN